MQSLSEFCLFWRALMKLGGETSHKKMGKMDNFVCFGVTFGAMAGIEHIVANHRAGVVGMSTFLKGLDIAHLIKEVEKVRSGVWISHKEDPGRYWHFWRSDVVIGRTDYGEACYWVAVLRQRDGGRIITAFPVREPFEK